MFRFKWLMIKKNKVLVGVVGLAVLACMPAGLTAKAAKQGYLGVSIERLSDSEKEEMGVSHGVRVTHVVKKSAAEAAGIQEDDVIQYFNNEKIRVPSDLVEEVRAVEPDSVAKVKLVRDGKEKVVRVTMGEYTPEPRWFGRESRKDKPFVWLSRRGYLGVQLQALDADLASYFGVKAESGALILGVEKDTPAQEAGLKSGDVIVKIDENSVTGPGDVSKVISEKEKGDPVKLTVIRQKKKKEITAELDESPFYRRMRVIKGHRGDLSHLEIPKFHFPRLHFRHIDPHTIIFGIPQGEHRGIFWYDRLDKMKEKQKNIEEKVHKKLKHIPKTISI